MKIQLPALVAINSSGMGLGNRIRLVLSGKAVADAEGRNFYYVWPKKGFGAALTDLWHCDFSELKKGEIVTTSNSLFRRLFAFHRPVVPALGIDDNILDKRDLPIWAIRHCYPIKGDGSEEPWENILRRLTPVDEIMTMIKNFQSNNFDINTPYVGVQIRAHSKTHSITKESSPLSWFLMRMDEIAQTNPETRFFVSCDSADAQKEVLRKFPSAAALSAEHEYNSLNAIRKSVADLYLLSDSTYLLAPYWSSFAITAWLLSGRRQPYESNGMTLQAGETDPPLSPLIV